MAWRVHSTSRIAVLPPDAADVIALLDDDERDSGFLELDSRSDPGHPRANDEHRKPLRHHMFYRRRCEPGECIEPVGHHGPVGVRYRLTCGHAHHPDELCS